MSRTLNVNLRQTEGMKAACVKSDMLLIHTDTEPEGLVISPGNSLLGQSWQDSPLHIPPLQHIKSLHIQQGFDLFFWKSSLICWALFLQTVDHMKPIQDISEPESGSEAFLLCILIWCCEGTTVEDGNRKHSKWIKCIPFRQSLCPQRGTAERRREGSVSLLDARQEPETETLGSVNNSRNHQNSGQ